MRGQIKKDIKILYPDLFYKLNGIFFEINKELGRFCKEIQYSDAIDNKLKKNDVFFRREKRIYKEGKFTRNILDFIVNDCIIIDVKAKKFITKDDFYQMKRYLKILNKELGLIVNFRDEFIKTKRVLNDCSQIRI